VTYGTFSPDAAGVRFPARGRVRSDFATMAAAGVNAVRTYTAPPRWVLDEAGRHGIWVMAGLAWEQHVAFLDEQQGAESIEASVRSQVEACAGHPAVLCFAVGNEIPTPLVRWHGRRRVEGFLDRLARAVREEAPQTLLTYVNYPSTEYLQLPFLDFVAFNLYLEDPAAVRNYLARLQNLAGDKPLVVAELGVDSLRSGLEGQAATLHEQLRIAGDAGCAGTFVFSWTDEWHRGDDGVLDWDFGLVDRARQPKPALHAVRSVYQAQQLVRAPLVSVIVCTHNGGRHISGCLSGVAGLRYPNVETIVVDDGSTDGTAAIASEYDVRLIQTENHGLSAARNIGLAAARGEFVAYLDDDAYPDPDWLHYLVTAFRSTTHAAVGGPNLPPPGDGPVAACVANAPGGPVHVLLSDSEAEHLPGCNMAFRRVELLAIGGFDAQFSIAGDDVDVCWRLVEAGGTLGFHPTAVVWHHRRGSVRAYLRQQRGYGRAEALLERKWPEKYTRRGHLTWRGRLYDRAGARAFRPQRIYHGTWGSGAFQPVVDGGRSVFSDAVATPDWYLLLGALAAATILGAVWPPLVWTGLAFAAAASALVAAAVTAAAQADLHGHGRRRLALRALIALLHVLQPAARLAGRLSHGLAPWRRHPTTGFALPRPQLRVAWHEAWLPAIEHVERIEEAARQVGARVVRGGPYARHDLELSGGALGSARMLVAIEEHGRGRQLVRCRIWPHVSPGVWRATLALLAASALGVATHRDLVGSSAVAGAAAVLAAALWEAGRSIATALAAFDGPAPAEGEARAPVWVRIPLRTEEA
jgi:O-antigen biosynthesis protein